MATVARHPKSVGLLTLGIVLAAGSFSVQAALSLFDRPAWTRAGGVNGEFGTTAGPAGDVNGDGYDDLLVGAAGDGRIFVFSGSANGLLPEPAWSFDVSDWRESSDAAHGLGDVDGDGFDDIGLSGPSPRLFRGSAGGLGSVPDWVIVVGTGQKIFPAGDVNHDGYDDVLVSDNWLTCHHGSASGPSQTPSQSFFEVGQPVALGDCNGDGYDDIVVRGYVGGEWVFRAHHGSADGLLADPAWTVTSAEQSFGEGRAAAGDVNGDGFADLILGSDRWTGSFDQEGETRIYRGSASGLAALPADRRTGGATDRGLGHAVSTAGDLNGDGFADYIVASRMAIGRRSAFADQLEVHAGTPFGTSGPAGTWRPGGTPPGPLGMRVALAGDVNGDGFSDVVVAMPEWSDGTVQRGRAWVFHGRGHVPASFAPTPVRGARGQAAVGTSVALVGDVNGDGFSDAVIGAPGDDDGLPGEGKAFLHLGSAAGLETSASWQASGGQAGARFGEAVGAAGDVNADGYADVLVGAPGHDGGHVDTGRAWLYHGGPGGLSATPAWFGDGDEPGGGLGSTVSGGDLDGDGRSDVLVGARRGTRALAWLSTRNGPLTGCADVEMAGEPGCTSVTASIVGDVDGDGLADAAVAADCAGGGRVGLRRGATRGDVRTVQSVVDSLPLGGSPPVVAGAGDVNADGLADVLVGLPDAGSGAAGRAQLHLGSAAGLDPEPAWVGLGPRAGDRFGASVASAGDVDGDGHSDLLVGAPGHESSRVDEGAAFVFLGATSGASPVPDWSGFSWAARARMGTSVAGHGDVNGDGFGDILAGGPGWRGTAARQGAAWTFEGNWAEGTKVRPPRQRRGDAATPLAAGGLVPAGESVTFALRGGSAFGRDDLRLALQLESAAGTPFQGPVIRSAWHDAGAPGIDGSQVDFAAASASLPPGRYRWRARVEGRFVLPWQGPWMSLPDNASTQHDFVVGGDLDLDGVPDDSDAAPTTWNPGQEDRDGDGVADALDDCADVPGTDEDCDGLCGPADPCPRDALDDADADGACADVDNCPDSSNPAQDDRDADGMGDACDACPDSPGGDDDGDGRCGALDPCPFDPANDADGDGTCAELDGCPDDADPSQADADRDGLGDACDACPADAANDADGDGACAGSDPCPADPADDADGDGTCADADICPNAADAGQEDGDADGLGDACDPCPADATNDPDGDGACDDADPCPRDPLDDADGDGACAGDDNCEAVPNADQADRDGDGSGDACDACPEDFRDDIDGDGACGPVDTCPDVADPLQEDSDADGLGDACDPCPADADGDADGDGVCASSDNCPDVSNAGQEDADGDGAGDACTSCDSDGDGVCDPVDACPSVRDHDQLDADGDGRGDACDPCVGEESSGDADADGICDDADGCPAAWDPSQADADGDGAGDACDCPGVPIVPGLRVTRGASSLELSWFPATTGEQGVHLGSVASLRDLRRYDHAVVATVTTGSASLPLPASNAYLLITSICGSEESSYGADSLGRERPPSARDADGDGVHDARDACPLVSDALQSDADGDGVGDACDACPSLIDPRQSDFDADGEGDACDACPLVADSPADGDADGRGDACDNCPGAANPGQEDADGDGRGDACPAGRARVVIRVAGVGDVSATMFRLLHPARLSIADADVRAIGPYAGGGLVTDTTVSGVVEALTTTPATFAPPAETHELVFGWDGGPPELEDFAFEPGSCVNNSLAGSPLPLTTCEIASLTLLP